MKLLLRRVKYFLFLQIRLVLDKFKINLNIFKIVQNLDSNKWKEFIKSVQPLIETFRLYVKENILITKADEILEHRFNLLGKEYFSQDSSGGYNCTYKPINWYYDPSSDYTFSNDVWYRFVRKRVPDGVDIKYPWELSRCQHFILLGEAYVHTQDEKYALEYRNQILDWIDNNPVRYGPNWSCTMEVSIRIANWLIALLYFIDSSILGDKFLLMLMTSVREHGHHIRNNLENLRSFTSNHYIANISSLYILSEVCPILKQSKRWKTFAKKELENEIFRQTYEDGWDFESSSCYHRLVTEMFLYPFLLADYLGEPFSDNYAERLNKMIEVLVECTKPGGQIPQIGDNDNGRFLVFRADRDFEDLRVDYIFETTNRNSKIAPNVNGSSSISFTHAGRYLFRSNRIYLIISAGPKGQAGRGGHAHNDVLSFELCVDGEDIIVDPGTYCYTSDLEGRNRFRSVSSHNTLSWEGLEPCSFDKGLFILREEGVLRIEKCNLGAVAHFFSAVYEYSGRFHSREIYFIKDEEEIEIRDSCSHESAQLTFVCAPGIEPELKNASFRAGNVLFSFDKIKKMEIESSYYSPAYGLKIPNKTVRVHIFGKSCVHTINPLRFN